MLNFIIMNEIFIFTACIGFAISAKSSLVWNIDKPYKYTGFIYTDSRVVIINPIPQIKISNHEEICNFYLNETEPSNTEAQPFRAVVKSAHLGLGEVEVKPGTSLAEWPYRQITLSIQAESCHDPDRWSEPAQLTIKVLDAPGPTWAQSSYKASISSDAPSGTLVSRLRAYLPQSSHNDNDICQYSIKSPRQSPFQIDGQGVIWTTEPMAAHDQKYWTLVIEAKDCSQPIQRRSQVKVFVTVTISCKFGWSGFNGQLRYKAGSGVLYISKSPGFHLCNYDKVVVEEGSSRSTNSIISTCVANKTLRLTTSVELKSLAPPSTDASQPTDYNKCKFDFRSLGLQREICGVASAEMVEILNELNRQQTGMLSFPVPSNIFPATSITTRTKFSFYFWMRREEVIGSSEQYIICEVDELGNNIFSVSVRQCILKVQLKSYKRRHYVNDDDLSLPMIWMFTLSQLCDTKWHHVAVHGSRVSEGLSEGELAVFVDGEIIEFKTDNPEILLSTPLQLPLSNMTDIFLGQCPRSEDTKFYGTLAGVTLTLGLILKSTTPRCLTKCSERLYFNGMNQMNPGMSVSLNSEMQMIIINGHSIPEVISLVKVIGFVNPSSDPTPGRRGVTIETEMSCGRHSFNVSSVNIEIVVEEEPITMAETSAVDLINLISIVSTIIVPDATQTSSDTGTGVAVFANTTLAMIRVPQPTNASAIEVSGTIKKCVVTMHPPLKPREYLDWPHHLLEAVSADKYSIKVTNSSRTLVFFGPHNQQVYQFVIHHLRYFSSTPDKYLDRASRTFKLQCFSGTGKALLKSNVAIVKVTIWYNNEDIVPETMSTTPSTTQAAEATMEMGDLWRGIIENITMARNNEPGQAQSNAAAMVERESMRRSPSNILYNILLCVGLLTLVSVLVMLGWKYRGSPLLGGCAVPYRVIDGVCFPLHLIKEKIRPSPSVRVELSRDFINCISAKRRDISMEMQWDDAEMKTNGLNIIANPMYETSAGDIDDISLNRDVPPACEDEYSTSEDDTYGDFTELYLGRGKNQEKVKVV